MLKDQCTVVYRGVPCSEMPSKIALVPVATVLERLKILISPVAHSAWLLVPSSHSERADTVLPPKILSRQTQKPAFPPFDTNRNFHVSPDSRSARQHLDRIFLTTPAHESKSALLRPLCMNQHHLFRVLSRCDSGPTAVLPA